MIKGLPSLTLAAVLSGSFLCDANAVWATTLPSVQTLSASDTGKVRYELQEKCARDARELYDREWNPPLNPTGFITLQNYRNHYSAKLGRCFLLIEASHQGKHKETGKPFSHFEKTLVDVLEHNELAAFDWYTEFGIRQCIVTNTTCKSEAEWQELLKPYMQD